MLRYGGGAGTAMSVEDKQEVAQDSVADDGGRCGGAHLDAHRMLQL